MQAHLNSTKNYKILKNEATNQKSIWRGGGVTYQGVFAQNLSSNDGLWREIENHLQEQQERKFQGQNSCFWEERERERKKTHLEVGPVGPKRPVGAARGQGAPAGHPPGQPQVPLGHS